MRTTRHFAAIAHAMTLICLSGCGEKTVTVSPPRFPPAEPPLVSRATPGRYSSELRLVCVGTPQSFNPLVADDAASVEICQWLFSSLVRMDFAAQEVRPSLAESWQVAPDQRTWTFKLRSGLRWSDGHPLTADDVAFTWNEVIYNTNIQTTASEIFRNEGKPCSVTTVDDLTVQIVTPDVFAPFLEYFGQAAVLPKHVLSRAVQSNHFTSSFGFGTPPDQIVSCGPYRLKSVSGEFIVLERNPDYWAVDGKGQRLPYFNHVIYTVTADAEQALAAVLKGEVDIFDRIRPVDFTAFEKANRLVLTNLGPGLDRDFLLFNQHTGTNANGQPMVDPPKLKWFRETKFRQAIACALDQARLVRDVYGGRAVESHGFTSPDNKLWHNPDAPRFAFDLQRAKSLLAEIGIQDRNQDGVLEDDSGNPIEFTLFTNTGNPMREKTASIVRENLAALGIRMTVYSIDFPGLIEKVSLTGDYECVLMGIGGGGTDPTSQMNVLLSDAPLHQWFPAQEKPSTEWERRVDALMHLQLHTLDFAARKKAFDEVQHIIGEQQPMIFTATPFAYAASRPDIANVRPSALTASRATWNIEELFRKQ